MRKSILCRRINDEHWDVPCLAVAVGFNVCRGNSRHHQLTQSPRLVGGGGMNKLDEVVALTQAVTAESKRIEQRIEQLLTEMELKVDRINGEGNIKQ